MTWLLNQMTWLLKSFRLLIVICCREIASGARVALALCFLGIVGPGSSTAFADLVRLENGGEVRGLLIGNSDPAAGTLTVETLSGGKIAIPGHSVKFVAKRPLNIEQYESRARRTPDNAEAQWKLAEWCREQKLGEQREQHLRRAIELDENHEKAHRALGHSRWNGVWKSREEAMADQGLIKYKGRYITRQEIDLLEKNQEELDAQREWFKKVRLWYGWMGGKYPEKRGIGYAELQKIRSPAAVPALARLLRDDQNKLVRQMYVEILAKIPGPAPVAPLVHQSLYDVDYEIRYHALNAITEARHALAAPFYLKELRNEQNVIVCRAAASLERVGDESAIPRLIDALSTVHRYRVRVPDQSSTYTFGTDGSYGNGVGNSVLPADIEIQLRTGQLPNGVIINNPNLNQLVRTKVVTIRHQHQNAEVLSALQKLTGQRFGYDKRSWKLWWTAEKSGTLKKLPG